MGAAPAITEPRLAPFSERSGTLVFHGEIASVCCRCSRTARPVSS